MQAWLWGVMGLVTGLGVSVIIYCRLIAARERLKAALQSQTAMQTLHDALNAEHRLIQNEHSELKGQLLAQNEAMKQFGGTLKMSSEAILKEAMGQARKEFEAQSNLTAETRQKAFDDKLKLSMEPITKMVQDYKLQLEAMAGNYQRGMGTLDENIKRLASDQQQVIATLRTNKGAGSWGEIQLLNILESSGLRPDIDYEYQPHEPNGIPDIKIKLPDNRFIYIDAKTLRLTQDDMVSAEMNAELASQMHRKQSESLRAVIKDLAGRDYTANQNKTPDFVILFVPLESMMSNVMAVDHALWQTALDGKILLAGPLNLVAMLRTIAHIWKQIEITDNMDNIVQAGRELHDSALVFIDRVETVSENITTLTKNFQNVRRALTGQQGLFSKAKKLERLHCGSTRPVSKRFKAFALSALSKEFDVDEPETLWVAEDDALESIS